MHAIFETGGKQYRAGKDDAVYIEKMPLEAGESVTFDRVLAIVDEGNSIFGSPYVDGASVTAEVVKSGKTKKIHVLKYKKKKGYRKMQGHRQPFTLVRINEIKA